MWGPDEPDLGGVAVGSRRPADASTRQTPNVGVGARS
jgi:hypothetical protein